MDDPYLEDSPSCEQSPVATPSNASTSGSARGLNQSAVKQRNAGADVVDGTTRKKVSRMPGGGLRQFSVMVCKKLESKGSTTYAEVYEASVTVDVHHVNVNDMVAQIGILLSSGKLYNVADEIIEEFATAQTNTARSLDEFHEKNVRRRVYDALNVLMALDIITREKKEIRWKGLSTTTQAKNLEELKALHVQLMTGIAKKAAYLKDLEEQIAGLQNIIERNQQLLKKSSAPKEGFTLPFILVQCDNLFSGLLLISAVLICSPLSPVYRLAHMLLLRLRFLRTCNWYTLTSTGNTPFSLHDDAYVLKLMRYYQRAESRNTSQSSSIHSSSSSCKATVKPFYWNSETETPR
ncbi:E2F/DP family [Theobroma cacao]|nr:E2F/DP family [Theobroma cacao]